MDIQAAGQVEADGFDEHRRFQLLAQATMSLRLLLEWTGAPACAMIGPSSRCMLTKCAVTPMIFTPCS